MKLRQYTPERQSPPSTYAIAALVNGEPGAAGRVVTLTLSRAIPIGVGLRIAGQRERLVRSSLIVSTSITVAMLGYAYGRKRGWFA